MTNTAMNFKLLSNAIKAKETKAFSSKSEMKSINHLKRIKNKR